MAAIITRRRWARQPSVYAQIERRHPSSSGLVGAYNFAIGLGNCADPTFGACTAGSGGLPPIKDSRGGIGYKNINNSTSSPSIVLPSFSSAITATGECSILAILSDATLDGNPRNPWNLIASGGSAEFYCYSDNKIYLSPMYATRIATGQAPVVDITAPHILSAQLKAGNQRIAQNGITLATTTQGAAPAWGSNEICGSYIAGYYSPLFAMLGFFLWNRYVTDVEINALSDNPWQLFKPRTRRLYVGIAAASASFLPPSKVIQQAVNRASSY